MCCALSIQVCPLKAHIAGIFILTIVYQSPLVAGIMLRVFISTENPKC